MKVDKLAKHHQDHHETSPERRRHLQRKQIIDVVWLAALSIILVLVVTLVGVYQLGWQNAWTAAMSHILPLPVATSSEGSISYRSYITHAHSLEMFLKNNPKSGLSHSDLNKQAMAEAKHDLFVANYAKQHSIKVRSNEIADQQEKILSSHSDRQKYLKSLSTDYGLSLADLQAQIGRDLLESKVSGRLNADAKSQDGYRNWLTSKQEKVTFKVLIPQAK